MVCWRGVHRIVGFFKKENTKVSLKKTIITGVLGLALVASAFAQIPAITPTVDGTRDAGYGTAVALQGIQTSFGDHPGGVLAGGGGELDGLYLANDNDNLYVMMTGNEEMNWNSMIVFIDNVANVTGDDATLENVSGGDSIFEDTGNGIGGMVLPDGFNVDLIVVYKAGNSTVDFRIQAADYVANAVTFDVVPDYDTLVDPATNASFSASVINSLAGSEIISFAVNNSNGAGVDGGSPGQAVPTASAEAVTTGIETAIPLSLIPGAPAPGDDLQIFVAYCSGDGNFFSNQVLPNVAAPQDHYATDPDFSSAGFGITPAAVTAGTPLLPYSDDFDTDTTANYATFEESGGGTPDAGVTFLYDYSTFTGVDTAATTIPPSPNGSGTSLGLRLEVNNFDAVADTSAVNVYPIGLDIPAGTNYRMTFDAFIMYNGDAGGGTGSTEELIAGLNTSGTKTNWRSGTDTDGVFVTVTGEGGSATDYGLWNGVASAAPTQRPETDGFHTLGDDNAAPVTGAPYDAYFPSPPFETAGAVGKQWVEVALSSINGAISWTIDGNSIVGFPNDTSWVSGIPFIGYADPFSSIATPSSDNFAVIDNLLIEEIIQTNVGGYELYR